MYGCVFMPILSLVGCLPMSSTSVTYIPAVFNIPKSQDHINKLTSLSNDVLVFFKELESRQN